MEKEQQEKEQQMRKLAAELELTKQRTEEARKVAELNKSRAENAERQLVEDYQSLNLSAKEKLTERDVQAYKYWLIDYAREDCFESLVDWVELRVQVIGEAREETEGFGKKNEERGNKNRDERPRFRGFNTRFSTRHCIVSTCKQDHPPWVCDAFKRLPVQKRKELISKSSRCYRCLAAGHHSKDCRKARKCGVDGCQSNNHSSYLHESTPQNGKTNARQQLEPDAPTFYPRQPPAQEARTEQSGRMDINNQQRDESSTQERTHKTIKTYRNLTSVKGDQPRRNMQLKTMNLLALILHTSQASNVYIV
ncbi:E3 ubiquitin- ligase DZIP3 [Paramuricea clavata]|uniref:E3 ubiquitin- ligase DZIP3 n=1 Tax=Paramuricea clavata TaxID=317549 RepID=A0A6S7FJ96_PARCT|nr:E3 ubiquitin- ligase DZIP3 [Paramuricea clavata]